MNRGAWRATVHGVTNSRTWLSDFHTHTHTHTQPAQVSVNRLQESYLQLNSFECAILLSKVIEGSFFLNVYGTQVIYIYTQDYILTLTYLFFLILPSH